MTPTELKSIRKSLGLSLQGMADKLGMKSERSIRRWEAGTHPIPMTVQMLIKMLFAIEHERNGK